MREGSYMAMEPGMRVIGAGGENVGTIAEVLADEASGIFHGLAVRHGLLGDTRFVPAEEVERLHEGVVYITTRRDELQEYVPAREQWAEARQEYG
jgi:hypothetical protein